MIKSLYPFARKWSEKGSVWMIGDTHFDDPDCKLMDPNWLTPEQQIKAFKIFCHKNDTLVILGDVGNPKYLESLKCYKVLIAGNHDGGLTKFEPYFDEVYGGPLFISDRILLSHEPMPDMPYVLNFHGHNHNGDFVSNTGRQINLASNLMAYLPVNLGESIKDGILSDIPTIHRYTIDKAVGEA